MAFTIHVDVSGTVRLIVETPQQNDILRRLDQLGADVQTVKEQGAQTMTTLNDAQALLQAMNIVTNDLSATVNRVVVSEASQLEELAALRAQVAQGTPVTQEQLDGLVATMTQRRDALAAVRDHLQTIAADPADPTPEVPDIALPA